MWSRQFFYGLLKCEALHGFCLFHHHRKNSRWWYFVSQGWPHVSVVHMDFVWFVCLWSTIYTRLVCQSGKLSTLALLGGGGLGGLDDGHDWTKKKKDLGFSFGVTKWLYGRDLVAYSTSVATVVEKTLEGSWPLQIYWWKIIPPK